MTISSAVTIRRLIESDAEIYQFLRLEALQNDPEAFGATYEETEKMPLQEVGKRLNQGDGSFVLGAFNDGKICATTGMFRQKNTKSMHKGVVWGVYVTPSMRGKGISRALMLETIKFAREIQGIEELLLTVVTENQSANKLYDTLGFKQYGVEVNALKIGDSYCSERLMRLVLNSGQNPM